MSSRFVISGIGAARGMTLGRARLVEPSRFNIDERPLPAADVDAEVARLRDAIAHAREELREIRDKLSGALAREVGEFIDA
ncbi:MAG TPA: phosphoenolpyruvate-utilizing N-terminal domain-containing protein, partial [Burkholderia sp.]|nr:phosphoenolpyruvate-utilizing N-terminal domain-containing protein [Burkholderia sp.]